MKATLKPAEIAVQCNVTSNSIRNWSREFREYLSEGANARERSYTEHDATVLRYISTLKQEGMKTPEIAERLAETKFGEVESAEIKPAPASFLVAQPASQGEPGTEQISIVALDAVRALERRFEALERSKEEDKRSRQSQTLIFVLGLTAGIVLTVGLLAVAALMMGR